MIIRNTATSVPESDWDAFFSDAVRSDAMLALKPAGTGNLVKLYRGVGPDKDGATVSSWTDNRADAASFGQRVRVHWVRFNDVVVITHHHSITEFVVVGHPES